MRRRQLLALVPAVLRGLPRTQLAGGAIAALALVWLMPVLPGGAPTIVALQYAAVALSLALAQILDEPGADTVAAVPATLALRRGLTFAVAMPMLVAVWAGLLALGGAHGASAGAVTLQLAALVLLTLALGAAWAARRPVAGPLVALAFLTACIAAPEWALRPDFGEWRWNAIWIGLTAGALVLLLLTGCDPARARRGRATGARTPA